MGNRALGGVQALTGEKKRNKISKNNIFEREVGQPWKNSKSRGTPLSPAKSASGLSESTPARCPCVSSEVPSLLDPT